MSSWCRLASVFGLLFAIDACSSDVAPSAQVPPHPDASAPEPDDDHAREGSVFSQLPELCMRDGDDVVRDVFCADVPPAIRSFAELQELLRAGELSAAEDPGSSTFRGFNLTMAVLGHSTALSGRLVSPINPRLIIVRNATIVTFQRGVQRVELVTPDRSAGELKFYLIEFEQACNAAAAGCSPGDLYTPKIETDWTRVRVRDDEDLKNTAMDCRQCHQRGREKPSLLMRELQSPWTHFFYPLGSDGNLPGSSGADLLEDYLAAKGDETYGGMAVDQVAPASPFQLEATVGPDQPLLFDAARIDNERWPYTPETGYAAEPRPSPTWERAYEAFKRGEQLALPYFDGRVSDLDKQRRLSEAYARYRSGELAASDLPDLADIFPDDPMVRARMGLSTEPGASAQDALIQACASCHNDVLDQEISRARFNVSVSRLDRASLNRAIERLARAPSDPGVMPPPEARQLDDEARAKLIDYLRGPPDQLDPDHRLEHAAQRGMSGGGLVRE